jgi:UDP-GlcNAc:undecaprenyl-phosphate GlcNAc-1-phosphate transferase
MGWWNIYLVVLLAAGGTSLLLTTICRKVALLTNFVDRPHEQAHKGHREPIPLLGGVALCLSWLLVVGGGLFASRIVGGGYLDPSVTLNLGGIFKVSREMLVLATGAGLATLLGLWDDRYNMRAITKLGGQLVVAILAVTWGGARITLFIHQPEIGWAISVFWFLLVMNAINFFDNMDGLAVGTATIAFFFFTLAAAIQEQYFVAALGASFTGAALGFWFFNHAPATIFMGDSGSHFLGYALALMGILVNYYRPDLPGTQFSILIPCFILAIPMFDVAAVVVIRLRNRQPIYIGDHNHISHRFLRMGMTRPQSVLMVHLLALCISLSVLPLMWGDERTTVVCLLQACTILLLVSLLQSRGRKD